MWPPPPGHEYSLVVNRNHTLNIEFRGLQQENIEIQESILEQLPAANTDDEDKT